MKKFGKKFGINTSIKISLLLILLYSCTQNRQEKSRPLARVFDKTLYLSDIPSDVYAGKKSEDSSLAVNNYVEKWVDERVFEHFAEQNTDTAYVNRMARAYRRQLLFDIYENNLKSNLADEIKVSEQDLKAYYEREKNNLLSGDTLVRWRYLIVPARNRNNAKYRKWFFSTDTADAAKLEARFKDFIDIRIDTANWQTARAVHKIFPFIVFPKNKRYLRRRWIKIDKNALYLAEIKAIVYPGETLPYAYAKSKISAFVKQRKLHRKVRELRKEMLMDAIKNKQVKYYNK